MITNGIKLTLYKNCRINDGYKNVFCQTKFSGQTDSPFDRYLNSLAQYEVEVNEVYQEDNTEFNFYLSNNDYTSIYEYNYMKIESFVNGALTITRFAFINSIKIVNELAVLNYKIDIWHTFSPSIVGLNKSYIKGKRIVGISGYFSPTPRFLPVNYEGNNKLQYEKLTDINRYMIILQVQVYNTSQFGEATKSDTRYFCISWYNYLASSSSIWINRNLNNIDNIEFFIQVLTNVTGEESFCFADDRATELTVPTYPEKAKTYWKIGNIFVIPYYSALDSKFHWYDKNFTKFESSATGEKWYVNLYECESIPTPILLENFNLQNDYKLTGIGLFGMHLPIIPNGTNINFSIYASVSRTQFLLYINYQNKILEITNHFEVIAPSTQINGEIIAQQKISRELKNRNSDLSMISAITGGAMGEINSFGQYARGDVNYARGMLANDVSILHGNNSEGTFSPYSMSLIAGGITGMASGGAGMILGGINIATNLTKLSIERYARNLPVYNTTNIVKVNNIAMLNAKEWIVKFLIDSDNDDFVKESINNLGYTIYSYIDYIPKFEPDYILAIGINYDVLQYGIADVYGSFPNNIAKQLNAILENGIKYWYDYQMREDTYN